MKQFRYFYIIVLELAFLVGCSSNNDASQIVQDAIKAHGGNNYNRLQVQFIFRNKNVMLYQRRDSFNYATIYKDSTGQSIKDELSNQGFHRKIDGQIKALPDSMAMAYKEVVNSIAYFVLLPYKLSEPAVQLEYLGQIKMEDNIYNKIKVSFKQESGGTDYKDVFCYWFNTKTKMLDFLAYSNGGPRFRKATKRTTVKGVVFQDYENYELLDTSLNSIDYDSAFIKQQVKLLSKIEQTNYK